MSRGDIILRLVDVRRVYETKEGRKIVALNNVTTSFKRGEFVAVVGKSGSGKSTLINILGGLDTPDGGDYFLEGNNIASINEGHWDAIRNEKIGFIFQEYHLVEYLSVYKNVEIALKYQASGNKKTKDAKVRDILTRVGLIDHIHKLPNQLSGGQRQRVAIARALVKDPDIILADEPTGALDFKTSEQVIELIKGLSKERLVIVVTHDRGIANEHATRIIELTEGKFTSDLIREDIEQTYQNVYRKTLPTNLSFRDKMELTFSKIRSQWLRTLFTALSLALAFSFTILFNGVERGISSAYDAYYEALNKANSYGFSLVMKDDQVQLDYFTQASTNLTDSFNSYFNGQNSQLVNGFSTDVAFSYSSSYVEHVYEEPSQPDVLSEYKLRLIDVNNPDKYSFNDLFIGASDYPYEFNETMVTSKFFRDYTNLSDDISDLSSFVGSTIQIPTYSFFVDTGIYGVEEYLSVLVELDTGEVVELTQEIEEAGNYSTVRYLTINLPEYCYNYDDIIPLYQDRCDQIIKDDQYSRYFESIDEYIEYIDDFKAQVNNIDPEYFNILWHSGAVYYVVDENELDPTYTPPFGQRYIERVYRALFEEASTDGITYFQDGVFREQDTLKTMYVTGIIDNENEAIIYLDQVSYNNLFFKTDDVEFVNGYYSVNLESGIRPDYDPFEIAFDYFALPLNSIDGQYQTDFEIIRKENIEQGEVCAIYDIDNVLNEYSNSDFTSVPILGDVFTIADYSNCKVNSESYHYLSSIRILFGVFFNVLMLISILFFHILLQVILGERIGEIGIYRSVGSTSKDIKKLFFIEILFEVILASTIAVILIYIANGLINTVFLQTINQGSGVITFAGMKLSLGDAGQLTKISFFNLLFYIVVVFALLGFLSNRSVSKLANTKPIDILREVD